MDNVNNLGQLMIRIQFAKGVGGAEDPMKSAIRNHIYPPQMMKLL